LNEHIQLWYRLKCTLCQTALNVVPFSPEWFPPEGRVPDEGPSFKSYFGGMTSFSSRRAAAHGRGLFGERWPTAAWCWCSGRGDGGLVPTRAMCRGSDLLIKFLITSRAPSDTVSLFIFVLFVSAAGLVYASEYVVVGFRWGFRPSHRIKVYFGVFFPLFCLFMQVGSLRFCGSTEFSGGLWAGVELDKPEGKNAGSVAGVQYFTCGLKHGRSSSRVPAN